jgi:hypothetical protein
MSPRRGSRTQACGHQEARTCLAPAEKFLDVARLIDGEPEAAAWSVAASLAVLAGIAASDAACCSALGRRSRGDDHLDATALLATLMPDDREASAALRRLIELKDKAQYGIIHVSRADLKTALKQAERMVTVARDVLDKAPRGPQT